jgi:hypothetical protein
MGMDVIGKNAKTERGEYFRRNVWGWRPLWDYALTMHGDITGKVEYGHSNDGDGLGADDAYRLGLALYDDLADGIAERYVAERNVELSNLPDEDCTYCGATGIRSDAVGVDMGMPTRELDQVTAAVVGRTHGWCNGCGGRGKNAHFETNYSLSVEDIREFAHFLVECGGFEIY